MQPQKPARAKAKYHHGDLRETLIKAIQKQVSKRGVEEMSLADACRAAGVSTAAPYRHFKDRDEILSEVTARGFAELLKDFKRAIAKHGEGTPRGISAMGQAYVAFAKRWPGLFRLMFGQARNMTKSDTAQRSGSDCFGYLIEQVSIFCAKQKRPDDARPLAASLWTFVHGASALLIDGKYDLVTPGLDINGMIDRTTESLLRPTVR